MTYSIAARDPITGQMGVAVQSHHFGVGPIVPWGEAGVGVVATQSIVEVGYGPRGLDAMRGGRTARESLDALLSEDPMAAVRQVAMIDANGTVAVHTGAGCVQHAGHEVEGQTSAQANMMATPTVWSAMLAAYSASTEPDLAGRLCAALDAGEREGGDIRGRQSAAILVVGATRTERPWDHRLVDLRVDDHPDPLGELRRLLNVSRAAGALDAVLNSGILFAPSVSDEQSAPALAQLAIAQQGLAENHEPTFWAAILLAKAGRIDQARAELARATGSNAQWPEYVRRVSAAGVLADDVTKELLGP